MMLHYLKLDSTQTVREFTARLRELNSYLPYFPVKATTTPVPFTKDELSSILNHTKPAKWQMAMLSANIDVYEMSWDQLVEYFEHLELSQSLETRERKNKNKHSPEHHNQHHEKKNKKKEKTCLMCKKKGHTKEDCWWNPENANNKLKKSKHKKFKKGHKQEVQQQRNHSNDCTVTKFHDCTVTKFQQKQTKEKEERHERKRKLGF